MSGSSPWIQTYGVAEPWWGRQAGISSLLRVTSDEVLVGGRVDSGGTSILHKPDTFVFGENPCKIHCFSPCKDGGWIHIYEAWKRGMVPECTFVLEHFWFLSYSPVAMQGIMMIQMNCTDLSFLINQRVVENYSVKLYMIEHVAATLSWDNSSKWKLLQQYCLSCPCFTFKIGIMIFRNKIFTDMIFFSSIISLKHNS